MNDRVVYHRAAAAYLAYGVLYEAFAAYSMWVHGFPPGMTAKHVAAFLTVGGVITFAFPWLLWRGIRWFARMLSILVLLRVVALVGILTGVDMPSYGREFFFLKRMSSPTVYVLSLIVSMTTLWFVSVAAWKRPPRGSA